MSMTNSAAPSRRATPAGTPALEDGRWPALFTPFPLGELTLTNRIVMAPMTRSRAAQPGDVPTRLNAEYYAQRGSAGLIITEAAQISREGQGYAWTPGIYTADQRDGWRLVADAVHEAGGRIFLQLWHVGRVSHPSIQPDGRLPVAPSAVRPRGVRVYVIDPADGVPRFLDCETPRALTLDEIRRVIDDYRQAAALAMDAGMDGVEIHGANGYLIEQFLRSTTNVRDDRYGGSPENRIRFLREVASAVAAEVGRGRVGVRLSPHTAIADTADPEIVDTALLAVDALREEGIAYLHLSEADRDDAPVIPREFRVAVRERFDGPVMVAGGYTAARAAAIIEEGHADLVAFGRPFIANPDLPRRFADGLPLNEPDRSTFFGGGTRGYADYPTYHAA